MLHTNLFSQNLSLFVCMITTMLVVLTWQKLLRRPVTKKSKKAEALPLKQRLRDVSRRYLPVIAVGISALTVCMFVKLEIERIFSTSLPGTFVIMLLPAAVGVATLLLILYAHRRLWHIGGVIMVSTALFSSLLLNSYYRLYPSLSALAGKGDNTAGTGSNDYIRISEPRQAKKTVPSIEDRLAAYDQAPKTGHIETVAIAGTRSGFNARPAQIYVPAAYSQIPDLQLPVIELLPGFPGQPNDWITSGLQSTMDRFAKQHDGVTPLVVIADNTGSITNDTECVDSGRGNVETYLTSDVRDFVTTHYRVDHSSHGWAVGGLSMGGTCGLMLSLRHPDLYEYFLDFGGEAGPEVGDAGKTTELLFNGSRSAWQAHQPQYLLSHNHYTHLSGYIAYGSADDPPVLYAGRVISAAAKNAGVPATVEVIPGHHTYNVWQTALGSSLPWVSYRMGATECVAGC